MIDGVDLQLMDRKQVVNRANQVAYKFWQYGRLRSEENNLLQMPFSRIGVVLDGSVQKTKAYFEAHDFALHQFQKKLTLLLMHCPDKARKNLNECSAPKIRAEGVLRRLK